MASNKLVLVCTAVTGACLYLVYALFLVLFVQHLSKSALSLVETAVIVTQIARLAGIVAYFGSKPARVEVLLVLLSLETFVVMGLILLYLMYPSAVYSNLAHTVFSTWSAALFTILPSYLIFAGVTEMSRHRSLASVLVSVTLEFGFLVFAATTLLGTGSSFTFANFFDFLVNAVKTDVAAGTIPQVSALFIVIPSAAVYCALLVYAAIPTATGEFQGRVAFVIPFLGAAVALAWVYGAANFLPNTLLSFTVPGIAIVALLWAYARN